VALGVSHCALAMRDPFVMQATPVDPRDTRWEVDDPTYRVSIWSPLALAPGWRSAESDVTGADIDEVLAWAREQTPRDGTFTVWVRAQDNGVPGLYRVAGWEPTRTDDPPAYVW
jgi:hypothetical protein